MYNKEDHLWWRDRDLDPLYKESKSSQPVGFNVESVESNFDDFGLGAFPLAGSEVYKLTEE